MIDILFLLRFSIVEWNTRQREGWALIFQCYSLFGNFSDRSILEKFEIVKLVKIIKTFSQNQNSGILLPFKNGFQSNGFVFCTSFAVFNFRIVCLPIERPNFIWISLLCNYWCIVIWKSITNTVERIKWLGPDKQFFATLLRLGDVDAIGKGHIVDAESSLDKSERQQLPGAV